MSLDYCRTRIGTRVAHITRGSLRFGNIERITDDGQVLILFDGPESELRPLPAVDLVPISLQGRRTR